MRYLAIVLSLGLFTLGSTSVAAACSGMQTAQKDQVIASSSKSQSTPIPARQGG